MTIPASGEDANITDVTFGVSYTSQNLLHSRLGISRESLESHWYAVVTERPKWHDYGAQLPAFLIQFKGVVLHGYVQFGQKLKPLASA